MKQKKKEKKRNERMRNESRVVCKHPWIEIFSLRDMSFQDEVVEDTYT